MTLTWAILSIHAILPFKFFIPESINLMPVNIGLGYGVEFLEIPVTLVMEIKTEINRSKVTLKITRLWVGMG